MQNISRTTGLLAFGLCTSSQAFSYSTTTTNITTTITSTTMGFEPSDHQTSTESLSASASEMDLQRLNICPLCGHQESSPQPFCIHGPKTLRRTPSGTRKMARSLRRMGDELYLRRMPLHNLVTIFLLQMVPGGWGKSVLSRWLTPRGESQAEDGKKTQISDEELRRDSVAVLF